LLFDPTSQLQADREPAGRQRRPSDPPLSKQILHKLALGVSGKRHFITFILPFLDLCRRQRAGRKRYCFVDRLVWIIFADIEHGLKQDCVGNCSRWIIVRLAEMAGHIA
jgi:hypothetical protein